MRNVRRSDSSLQISPSVHNSDSPRLLRLARFLQDRIDGSLFVLVFAMDQLLG
jgi:hypothetical protein